MPNGVAASMSMMYEVEGRESGDGNRRAVVLVFAWILVASGF